MAVRASLVAGGVLAAAVLAGVAVYGSGSSPGNVAGLRHVAGLAAPTPCAEAAPVSARLAPLARGEVAAFEAYPVPRPSPAIAFTGPDGATIDLAALRGRTLLVNLWATWCAPCKAEMPALDRLQADLGGDAFQVVAINVETRNLDKPPAWLKANGIAALSYYGDPAGGVLPVLQTATGSPGLPTTLLVDSRGCALGAMKGPADWVSPDAQRLIRAAIGAGA